MSYEQSVKRRAVFTGLKPFLENDQLQQAIDHWENQYADAPRFTLQKFVSEICRHHQLLERRSDMLLSLVQAMNMPSSSLLPDPLANYAEMPDHRPCKGSAEAFVLLMTTLLERIPRNQRHSFRLDLLASIDRNKIPASLVRALHNWLADDLPLELASAPQPVLQAMVNRAYIVLCERVGPVEADRILTKTVNQGQSNRPELGILIAELL